MRLGYEPVTATDFPGDLGGGVTPVPIPNTAVKPSIANGTARATWWESRTLPGFFFFLLELDPLSKGDPLNTDRRGPASPITNSLENRDGISGAFRF